MSSKEKILYNAAKNMEHRLAALGDLPAPEALRPIGFRQSNALALHNPYPIMGTEINKWFGERVLFDKASFQIPLGAKVALTGKNGAGKTTLFQMIVNRETGIFVSSKAKIGYFAQNGYQYHRKQGIMEFLQGDCEYQASEIRSILASLGFAPSDIRKALPVLSGGEITKLLLAKMLLGPYNILLMVWLLQGGSRAVVVSGSFGRCGDFNLNFIK